MVNIITLIILSVFLVASLVWLAVKYNKFIKSKQTLEEKKSNVLTQYQRRNDLYKSIAKAVISHKNYERNTMDQIIKIRSSSITESELMLLAEQYPNLNSNQQHNKLIKAISEVEQSINQSRQDYNNSVREYNVLISIFPNKFASFILRFNKELYFETKLNSIVPDVEII